MTEKFQAKVLLPVAPVRTRKPVFLTTEEAAGLAVEEAQWKSHTERAA